MTKTGLIFDVDGTLCNTTDVVLKSWEKVLVGIKYPHREMSVDFIKQYMGKPMDDWAKGIMPSVDLSVSCPIMEACCQEEYKEIDRNGTSLYPHVHDVFMQLSEKYHLYILSNCGTGYIERIMKQADIESYVDGHLCFGDTGLDKPDNIKMLVKEQGLTACAYVGDTERDQKCCIEAGVPFIHAAYGFGTIDDSKYSIQKLTELPEVAEELFESED